MEHRSELDVGLGKLRREAQRVLRGLAGALVALVDLRKTEAGLLLVNVREPGPGQREIRIDRKRSLEQIDGLVGVDLSDSFAEELPL